MVRKRAFLYGSVPIAAVINPSKTLPGKNAAISAQASRFGSKRVGANLASRPLSRAPMLAEDE
jgi:hypothetical protein